jgi:mannose/fructose/N-acetylgalactosamine-specific phosphotransferase system component IIC
LTKKNWYAAFFVFTIPILGLMLYLRLTGWWSLGGTDLLSLYIELILIGVMAVYVAVLLLQLRAAYRKIQKETRKRKEKHESAQS